MKHCIEAKKRITQPDNPFLLKIYSLPRGRAGDGINKPSRLM